MRFFLYQAKSSQHRGSRRDALAADDLILFDAKPLWSSRLRRRALDGCGIVPVLVASMRSGTTAMGGPPSELTRDFTKVHLSASMHPSITHRNAPKAPNLKLAVSARIVGPTTSGYRRVTPLTGWVDVHHSVP